ncbi:MAG: response regulator transcription factor [Coriobacteriaceae bacterium]|nr:response regulator transcription factor [Coriobacteriaceae bacterium]MCI7438286.1 response regulator transcription factor [Coriobacteriaceae bacterium]MDD7585249.1 response regulator transcription factor [Coriobacteriaceae bacterium]
MTGLVSVMIVDDQAETRLGFALMLRRDPTLRLWGQAADGRQAVDAVDRATRAERPLPDVVLMDVRMPVMDGIDACALICERHPEVRVLILTTYDEDDYAFGGLEAGASGFLLKDVRSRELVDAVHAIAEGDAVLTPRVTRAVIERNVPKVVPGSERERLRRAFRRLTGHEREICSLIADGLSNAEIAERLVIQPASAKRAVSRVLTKLGMRDRTQVAVSWFRAGL